MKANVRSIRKTRKYSIEFKKRIVADFEGEKFSISQWLQYWFQFTIPCA